MNDTQVMLDTETLATSFDACIVSLGAVKFCLSKGVIDTFYVNIDPLDSKKYGCKIDKSTLEWWQTQPKEARKAWQTNAVPLKDAMESFLEWYGEKSKPTWAKGGHNFDFPILENAFTVTGLTKPWKYYDCLDYRTLLKVTKINDYDLKSKGTTIHNAMDDCIEQTKVLVPILQGFEHWEAF